LFRPRRGSFCDYSQSQAKSQTIEDPPPHRAPGTVAPST